MIATRISFWFILASLFFFKCQTAVITVPPVSVTVPPFTTATFTCEGTGDILDWIVQASVLTDSIKQQRQITVTTNNNNTNFSSVLTVNAIPINDDLGIGCEVITFNPFQRVISSSSLTVRGVSPVEDIQYSFPTNHSLLVTWSPPVYYSNDVPAGSPISYQVLVTDEDGDIILDTNVPDTNIEVPNITECDTFNISVTAILDQYSSNDDANKTNGNYSIAEYNAQPLTPSISFELGCPPSKCIVSLMDGNTEVTDITIETEHIIEFKLLSFIHYELTAVVKNLMGKTRATYKTSLSTFHTQDIIISSSYTNGSVSVQCVFVSGSTADGCHVIFTDTDQQSSLNILLPLMEEPTLVTLPAGNYTVTAYDNINGSLYGPAVQYPTLVEIKVIPSTSPSFCIASESTAPTQSIVSNNVSLAITDTPGTETTSSTSGTSNKTNNYVYVLVVAGIVSGIVLVILIILTVCVGITVYKKRMKVQVLIRSEFATAQQPQAETNPYQEVHEIMNEVPNNTSSVQLTNNIPIDDENPYRVNRSEFLPDYHTIPSHDVEGLMPQGQRPSLTSTTTQETTLEDSISSTTSNNIHDNAYTTDPAANDTITFTVNDTDTTTTVATATYAVIGKRIDTTATPTVVQRVVYDKVTGHINKRGGGVTVYTSDDIFTPPPPSYADTVAQERGAVSSSQFKVPVQVTDAAVVHGQ